MNEVCRDVKVEPKFQALKAESFVKNSTTTEDEAQLDIKANGPVVHDSVAFCFCENFQPPCKNCTKTHTSITKR